LIFKKEFFILHDLSGVGPGRADRLLDKYGIGKNVAVRITLAVSEDTKPYPNLHYRL